jgi:hypothetical protein
LGIRRDLGGEKVRENVPQEHIDNVINSIPVGCRTGILDTRDTLFDSEWLICDSAELPKNGFHRVFSNNSRRNECVLFFFLYSK